MSGAIRHPLLDAWGVEHGFGTRQSTVPRQALRPRQVHGARVALTDGAGGVVPGEADAIASDDPSRPVAVVTADCVPILAAAGSGRAVVAIHAGWKGLACGVIPGAIRALRALDPGGGPVVAVIGPHIGPDHYEVDEPVLVPLRERFGAGLDVALAPSRPGRGRLDLARLARIALEEAGVESGAIGQVEPFCTYADPVRFHSFRRDGAQAGRLVHHVRARVGHGGEPHEA